MLYDGLSGRTQTSLDVVRVRPPTICRGDRIRTMDRQAIIIELASICRRSHAATLAAVGWLALELPTTELAKLLEVTQDFAAAYDGPSGNHLEAYRERYGRYPSQ
jgi:hypothetical protein